MKITNIIKYKSRLLKLKLIKTKAYKKKGSLTSTRIESTEYRLKKALHVIYKYHTNNKRILFIGVPTTIDKETKAMLSNTKHLFIPESVWINGFITNSFFCGKYLAQNPKASSSGLSRLLFTLRKKKSQLVVIFNKIADEDALNEIYQTRVPIISLNCDLNPLKNESCYKVPGNFRITGKKVRNDFFFSLLKAAFKRANQLRAKSL